MTATTAPLRLFAVALLLPGLAPLRPAQRPSAGVPDPVPLHDCNANGVEDAVDIALGTSCDRDLDGVPDECQGPAPPPAGNPAGRTGDDGTPAQARGS